MRTMMRFYGAGLTALALACTGGGTSNGTSATDGEGGDTTVAPKNDTTATPQDKEDTTVLVPEPVGPEGLTESEKAFQGEFKEVLAESQALDYAALSAEHPTEDYNTDLGYDPMAAAHMDEIRASLLLTPAQESAIKQDGFVVVPQGQPTPSVVYGNLYRAHLPLLITSDSVLHALHQSFDDILKALELAVLRHQVGSLLDRTHATLDTLETPGELAPAKQDLDVFLAVARSLLAGAPVATNDSAAQPAVDALLAKVKDLRLEDTELFGSSRKEDFSQFEPRGHYTESEELKQYFRAMMWLGRIDFRFREFDPMTGEMIWNDRQIRGAWLLRAAVDEAKQRATWEQIDALIGAIMGELDSLDFRGFDGLANAAAFKDASAVAGDISASHKIIEEGGFGRQRISSHYLATNPFSADVTPTPIAFTMLGQRYIIDSHVMSNVVYDRITTADGEKPMRALPSVFDPMFVLGNNRALVHLESELTQWGYAGGLNAMRFLTDAHDATFWENSVYNLWLSAIRDLNTVPEGAALPAPLKTAAWADKTLNSQLASWAELRHDTILYAKQSYTGGVSCEYPDGYVEPYPALYAHLRQAAQRIATVVASVPQDETDPLLSTVKGWADHWVLTMTTLEGMATKELTDETFEAAEVELINNWIAEESVGCTTSFTGIYPKLMFDVNDITEADPTIADIHTNPNEDGPLAPARVLHVGTGFIDTLILTRPSCEGVKSYAGPVTSFYDVVEEGLERLTDEEWLTRMYQNPPARPAWTSAFVK
mgnify:CR=1 FL=1